MLKYSNLVWFILLFPLIATAQTITSKSTGGNWEDQTTWIGGVIPGPNNDVIIDGLVSVNGSKCKNITINASGTLQAISPGYCCYEYSLTVSGNLVNNGKTQDNPDGNSLALKIAGNITNNGSWKHTRTELTGTADQYLTLAANKLFESTFSCSDSLGKTIANSAIEFARGFNLNKSILDMKNYPLTLNGASTNIYDGRVINTGDLTGKKSPTLNNITYEGTPNIKGLFNINDVKMIGTLTITDTIQACSPGYCCYEYTLRLTGNLINNGVIRNNPDDNWLAVKVTGNITNNGLWVHARTDLTGTGDQYIALGQSKSFQSVFTSSDSLGKIIAASALEFTREFNLNGSVFDMKSYPLTLNGGSASIYGGRVINTASFTGKKSPTLNNITYEGNPNIKGVFLIRDVTVKGTLTVTDTVLACSPGYCCYEYYLRITGNIINNGVIQNNPDGNRLAIIITGNITNNGIWQQSRTEFVGNTDKNLSLGANKKFESAFSKTDTLGSITASSAIEMTRDFNLNGCKLNMNGYPLTLNGAQATIYNGRVINAADLTGKNYPTLYQITYEGNLNFKGLLLIRDATIKGTLTVTDTIWACSPGYCCYNYPLYVIGSVTNNGTIMNNPDYNGLIIYVSGNVTNNGKWNIQSTRLNGSGKRTILAKNIAGSIEAISSNVILSANNILPRLNVWDEAYCEVSGDGYVLFTDLLPTGNLQNKGIIEVSREVKTTGAYPYFALTANASAVAGTDTVTVYSYGSQIPFSYSNAVKRWWRIKQASKTFKTLFSSITLYYSDSELGGNNESNLQLYFSADSSKTWKQISTSANMTRNTTTNTITVTATLSEGDYLLSSNTDPTSVTPNVITTVIGSSSFRVGAPTRYKVHYVNNSDVTTPDFLISLNTGSKVHIKSVEIPTETGAVISLPKDSLFYANEDTTLVMYALSMAPHEERTFDVLVISDRPTAAQAGLSKVLFEPVSLTTAAVLTWVAWKAGTFVVCKAIDYIGDKAAAGIKMSPEEQKRYDDMVKGGIPDELKQKPGALKTFALKSVGVYVIKKTCDLAPGGEAAVNITGTITQNMHKVAPSLRQRIFNWFYKETGLYGVETTENGNNYNPQVSTVNQKNGSLVTSWDPNEKAGPGGYGTQRFITSAGKMAYNILFENKKEATAPAYKISVVDTLGTEFDPGTVEFGKTSHEGSKYNWIINRTGNILKWEIEGIELPPNVNPPEGEGFVSFTVSPKSGLASGTVLKNKATIVFDINKPITTNEYSNTLDFAPPTTIMNQLASSITNKSFTVKWKSSDGTNGSGVESALVFMSVDNGPYNMAGVSNSDSLTIQALAGTHTYSFYTLSSDYVGNTESLRPATVSTQVINSVDLPLSGIPAAYALHPNYPNPFNPVTNIRYSIPNESRVNIAIYNMLGQQVAELLNETRQAGNYEVQFDAGRLASGVYLYRISAIGTDGKTKYNNTRKMLLLK